MRKLRTEQASRARTALEEHDIEPILKILGDTYPYCEKCSLAYCTEHWSNIDVVFDEGFYDCTYATCPGGHRQIIDD